jgi:flagellar basal body-associated protein FliL
LEGKGSFFILLFIVAFLSLTLAALAGYVFFVAGTPKTTAEVSQKETTKRPPDEDLVTEKVFDSKAIFNLKSVDNNKIAFIQINAEISYYKKINGIKDTTVKITTYKSEIRELIATYFQSLTLEEVKQNPTKKKAKEDLKKQINELLMASEKQKNNIVYDIIFEDWLYQ